MLKIINDLPENVLGVAAQGKITGTDYETVFIPALKRKFGYSIILEAFLQEFNENEN